VKCLRNGFTAHVSGAEMDVCIPTDEPQQEAIDSHTNGRTVYIPERSIAVCPMGKVLCPSHFINRAGKAAFSNYSECYRCPCKCTKGKAVRFETDMPKESFSKVYDISNLSVRQIHIKPNMQLVKFRKSIAEHPFGTIKRNMDAGYCLTKGLKKVSGEFSLTFLAYNLKRAINILGAEKLIEYVTVLCLIASFSYNSSLF
jgi:transposase